MIYLDHAATTPILPCVAEAIKSWLSVDKVGNPSSIHSQGLMVHDAIEQSREQVARLINAEPNEIYFTSGGTESNNTWIKCLPDCIVLTDNIEHESVLAPLENHKPLFIPVDRTGCVKISDIETAFKNFKNIKAVSIMAVNNELGTSQPIDEIGDFCSQNDILFYTDAVQAIGHKIIDVKKSKIDMLSMSGHKFGAPSGIGCLFISNKIKNKVPLICGGGQENNLRSGTENIIGIIGIGVASEYITNNIYELLFKYKQLRSAFIDRITKLLPCECIINGDNSDSNIISLTIPNIESETLMTILDTKDVYVSAGSACSAKSGKPSRILTSIGLSDMLASCTIRVSIGWNTTIDDIVDATYIISEAVKTVKHFSEY